MDFRQSSETTGHLSYSHAACLAAAAATTTTTRSDADLHSAIGQFDLTSSFLLRPLLASVLVPVSRSSVCLSHPIPSRLASICFRFKRIIFTCSVELRELLLAKLRRKCRVGCAVWATRYRLLNSSIDFWLLSFFLAPAANFLSSEA